LSATNAHAAFSQAWPAFALVAGLLLIGAAAARENLFAAAGAAVARMRRQMCGEHYGRGQVVH